jgi:tetratricopeptide (TPR) repeat protein
MGQPEKALEYSKAALELNPRNDRAWFQQTRAYERLGDLNAAVDAAKRAIELNSRASSYYYVLATLYKRLGKTSESKQALEQFTKLDRESNEIDRKRREVSSGESHAAQLSGPPEGGARAQ